MITRDMSEFDQTSLEESYDLLKEISIRGFPKEFELNQVEFEHDSGLNMVYLANKEGQRLTLMCGHLKIISN
jgi:hypothetical protein